MKVLFCDACGRSNNGQQVTPDSESFVGPRKMDELINGSGSVDLCTGCVAKLKGILKSRGWATVEGK